MRRNLGLEKKMRALCAVRLCIGRLVVANQSRAYCAAGLHPTAPFMPAAKVSLHTVCNKHVCNFNKAPSCARIEVLWVASCCRSHPHQSFACCLCAVVLLPKFVDMLCHSKALTVLAGS